ncbi:MAG: hypothetical protein F4X72_08125 [Dehalococcoidia bacterium]|nr:hypothetical protein [Dehalococcoidia bacterium]
MERFVRTVKTDYHAPIQVGNREIDNRFGTEYVVVKMPTGGTTGLTTSQAMDFAAALLEAVKHVEQ